MNFKEFIEKEEEELFDLGIDEVLGSSLKFLGGFGGNAISQTGRGIGNLALGIGQGAYGLGQGGLGALQMAGGGSEKGKETLGKGWSNIKDGAKKIARGAVQAAPAGVAAASNVFTPGLGAAIGAGAASIIPAIRGAQAASEPIGISGVYAPASKNRTAIQDLLGLDSWKKPEPERKTQPTRPGSSKPKSSSSKPKDDASSFLGELGRKEKEKEKEEFRNLVNMYASARTSEERESIRNQMRVKYPSLYMQAVEAGRRKKRAT